MNWTPTPANWGPNTLTFTATDAINHSTTASYVLTVNSPTTFSSTPPTGNLAVGQLYTYNITLSDPDVPFGDVIGVEGTTIPTWLTLTDNGNGTATLSGTPGAGDVGGNAIQLDAEDIYHHCFGQNSQLFTINVGTPPTLDIQGTSTCANVNNGTASVAATGGTAPYSYQWTSSGSGATDVSGEDGSSITGLAPGTYSVTVTDADGLYATAYVVIANTISNFTVSPDVSICPGGSATLSASGADLYLWSTGENTSGITVTPGSTTTYSVTGYVSSGNLVTNGDFSAGNSGFTSDYYYVSPAANLATAMSGGTHTGLVPEGYFAVDGNAHDYHPSFYGLDHTTGTGSFFMITNGSGTPNTEVWSQTVNNIVPNTTYYFSTWGVISSSNCPCATELLYQRNTSGACVYSSCGFRQRRCMDSVLPGVEFGKQHQC